MIEAQLSSGYESGSDFRDAFTRIMGAAPAKIGTDNVLKAAWLDSPLGPMLAIADEQQLYLLEFVERQGLDWEIERLRQKKQAAIILGSSKPIRSIESELRMYLEGTLREFKTPICLLGTPFQEQTWRELQKIPYGETRSYYQIAVALGRPTAFRAIAQANGANQLAILIPCHRVINANGELGGYGGGIIRKKWLLALEKSKAKERQRHV